MIKISPAELVAEIECRFGIEADAFPSTVKSTTNSEFDKVSTTGLIPCKTTLAPVDRIGILVVCAGVGMIK